MGVMTGANTAGGDREHATQALNDRGYHQLGAHGIAALDDLRSGLLRGRDDAHLDAAL